MACAAHTTMSGCQAESTDGHEHTSELTEYVRICVRGHEKRGLICTACAPVLSDRGPAAVTCAECPDDDPRPGVLINASRWDEFPACRVDTSGNLTVQNTGAVGAAWQFFLNGSYSLDA